MDLNNSKPLKKNHILNNINDYFIQIDYFDKTGIIKHNNNIPLKHVFNQKPIRKIKSN